jgi:biopolymer transport protein ExbD
MLDDRSRTQGPCWRGFHSGMATIDVGGSSSRRELNRELTLVPFIDFLLCIVAFLLVTAVWSEMARLEVRANVPGEPVRLPEDARPVERPELHVYMRRSDRFLVEWRQGNVVISQDEIPRTAAPSEGVLRFPALATEIARTWARTAAHRAPTDPLRDRAVLHAGNTAVFEEIVAAMDAIHATFRAAPGAFAAPAFDPVFAVD